MKKTLVFFLLLAIGSAFAQENSFTYKIEISTIDSPSNREQRESAERIIHDVLPKYLFKTDEKGTFFINTTDEINPELLEKNLKDKNVTLTNFEKQQFNDRNELVFILYYKPKNRDRNRTQP